MCAGAALQLHSIAELAQWTYHARAASARLQAGTFRKAGFVDRSLVQFRLQLSPRLRPKDNMRRAREGKADAATMLDMCMVVCDGASQSYTADASRAFVPPERRGTTLTKRRLV